MLFPLSQVGHTSAITTVTVFPFLGFVMVTDWPHRFDLVPKSGPHRSLITVNACRIAVRHRLTYQ